MRPIERHYVIFCIVQIENKDYKMCRALISFILFYCLTNIIIFNGKICNAIDYYVGTFWVNEEQKRNKTYRNEYSVLIYKSLFLKYLVFGNNWLYSK